MFIHCPRDLHQCSVLVCMYKCKPGTKRKCEEYDKVYDKLVGDPPDPKYLEKYGDPVLPVPYSRRRRRKPADRPKTVKKVATPTPKKVEKPEPPAGCKDHPKYSGQRKPRTDCPGCWELYFTKHPDKRGK